MIEVKNLTKKYGNHIAVDGLSFKVETGQVYGFLGPNGAGKSTTMNIITGYLAATDGTVTIDGKNIQTEPELAKSKVGYLPELPPLYADMTVKEYLDFVAELKNVPKEERSSQVEKVMEETKISDMSGRLIRNLSKGYKQRVGMAQAIIGDPDVLIFDEPSVGLDPKQIIEVRDLIKKLGEKHTVILSSHILSEVSAVCDHIMIISKGKLVADGSPEELQNMMGGKAEIEITVLGDASTAADILKKTEGVDEVIADGQDDKGNGKLRVISATDVDAREAVSLKLAENRIAVMGMERREKSLEDIFLELTSKEDK
ncbi:MAG: ABC transporter ATP-binding protein [Lachnospiraceae bacterium]|nr:ABC transporter ATP-binding protein [Lachnospiraceae bacterium]